MKMVVLLLGWASLVSGDVFTHKRTGEEFVGEMLDVTSVHRKGAEATVFRVRMKSGSIRLLSPADWKSESEGEYKARKEKEAREKLGSWSQKQKDRAVVTLAFPTPAEAAAMPRLRGMTLAVLTIDCSAAKAAHVYPGGAGVVSLVLNGQKQVPCVDLSAEFRARLAAEPELLKRWLPRAEGATVLPGALDVRWVGFEGAIVPTAVQRVWYQGTNELARRG
ncbi:MAG TPA: hypothetical protein VNE39_18420 [Planctomycetota bacterium]|nr:hypothetical protein [Planctomycetota bacterium]